MNKTTATVTAIITRGIKIPMAEPTMTDTFAKKNQTINNSYLDHIIYSQLAISVAVGVGLLIDSVTDVESVKIDRLEDVVDGLTLEDIVYIESPK